MGGLWFISVNLFTNILIIVSAELLIFTKYLQILSEKDIIPYYKISEKTEYTFINEDNVNYLI